MQLKQVLLQIEQVLSILYAWLCRDNGPRYSIGGIDLLTALRQPYAWTNMLELHRKRRNVFLLVVFLWRD